MPIRFLTGLLLAVLSLPAADRVTITVLATTDLHGNLYPYDYLAGRPADRGLAKISSLIRAVRAETPNVLLIDCGDTIQGTPLEALYQSWVRTGRLPLGLRPPAGFSEDPMMLAMNLLGYDAMVLGNHEFNYGLKNLDRARAAARFPWLSANTVVDPRARARPFEPHLLKTIAGVKVAVIGLTTPGVPTWEKPENYRGYRFLPGPEAADQALGAVRAAKPDLVLLAAHSGLNSGTGNAHENFIDQVATRPGIDAIVFGHSHQQLEGRRIGDVLLVQPRNWGMSLARLDFVLDPLPGGGWKVVEKRSRLLPVTAGTPADEAILRLARPYHELAEHYLSMPVAESSAASTTALARVEDNALIDAVHAVQLHDAAADVSFTSVFTLRASVPKGPITARQVAALYIYDNELYAIEGTGRMVREALENSARYFLPCPDRDCAAGPLIDRRVPGFNFDTAQGVEYEIDLTRPPGDRIRNLRYHGRPLADDQKLRIAVNNYRVAGSAGYSMFRDAKILWRSSIELRDLIVDYYTAQKTLPPRADGNWRIVPDGARRTLEREVLSDAARPPNQ